MYTAAAPETPRTPAPMNVAIGALTLAVAAACERQAPTTGQRALVAASLLACPDENFSRPYVSSAGRP